MNEPLNIGVLGAGWFGREAHLANLKCLGGVNVIAASSRSETSLTKAKAVVGEDLRTSTDWRRILEIEAIDAVVIALPNHQHHAACLAAFEAGKHVLCEKPLGLTVQECGEIIDASETADRVLQVGHEMRFQRLYHHLKRMIDQGDIGDLHLMWCREFRGPMRPGWRSDEALSGGTILEKNSHHFDLFHWILDKRPIRVAATGGRNVLLDRNTLDNAQVLIEFEGERRANLELCLFAPYGGETEIGAVGNGGRIDTWNQAQKLVHHRFDLHERTEIQVADPADETVFKDASGGIDRGIRPELEHFIECCRTGKRPLTDGPSARMSVAMCLAAQESIKRREGVMIEEMFS
ncbi:MAG TPA: Gfo/Idh/MocA family oxidoreductase [Verrucomicrobiales bacterium]|nr:Gfo/Idh/MocA family oxidoreductase [Verrucomicrobiales bacterium]HIL71307.1 Gfo/Idh/MocA family oxidoreductase [Verrucomicrobiota bacterium]